MIFFLRAIILLSVVLSGSACSVGKNQIKPRRLSESRLIPVNLQVINVNLDRRKFIELLKSGGERNTVRLVRIFERGESSEAPPRYRLLDVKPGGIFDYMKLKEYDIILAADDYVIPKPTIFWEYVQLISGADTAKIELMRSSNNFLFEYNFNE